ncbi:MAG: NACHT domain-containing protein [Candidatus Aenigmarchaeota archaeon]|nr:NACHT domain-containing protein [Candidatus Aenigmarchaeota archaeon]
MASQGRPHTRAPWKDKILIWQEYYRNRVIKRVAEDLSFQKADGEWYGYSEDTVARIIKELDYISEEDAASLSSEIQELRRSRTQAPNQQASPQQIGQQSDYKVDLQALRQSCSDGLRAHLDRHSVEFNSKSYVPRAAIEGEFREFLDSTKLCFPIIGEAGMGKTTLLCHLADEYSHRTEQHPDHLVWVLSARPLANIRDHPLRTAVGEEATDVGAAIKSHLSRHLSMVDVTKRSEVDFTEVVEALYRELRDTGDKKFIVLIDALNEHPQADKLIASLDSAVASLADLSDELDGLSRRFKICVTCRPYSWHRAISEELHSRIRYSHYHALQEQNLLPQVTLGEYSEQELQTIYEGTKVITDDGRRSELRPEFTALKRDAPKWINRLSDPYLFACAIEVARKNDGYIPLGLTKAQMLRAYIDRLTNNDKVAQRLLAEITERMRVTMSPQLTRRELESCAQRLTLDLDAPDSPYNRLIDAGILQELNDATNDPTQLAVGIRNDRILEYLLYERLKLLQQDVTHIRDTLIQAELYPQLWAALHTLFVEDWDQATVSQLAAIRNEDQTAPVVVRAFIPGVCREVYKDRPKEVNDLVQTLLKSSDNVALMMAVAVAYTVKDTDGLLQALQNKSLVAQRLAIQYSYLFWRAHRKNGYALLNRLSDRISVAPDRKTIQAFVDLSVAIGTKHFRQPEIREEIIALAQRTAHGLMHPDLRKSGLNPAQRMKRRAASLILRASTSFAGGPLVNAAAVYLEKTLRVAEDNNTIGNYSDVAAFFKHVPPRDRHPYKVLLNFWGPEEANLVKLRNIICDLAHRQDGVFYSLAAGALVIQAYYRPEAALKMFNEVYDSAEQNALQKRLVLRASDVLSPLASGKHLNSQLRSHSDLVRRFIDETAGRCTVAGHNRTMCGVPLYHTSLVEVSSRGSLTILPDAITKALVRNDPELLVSLAEVINQMVWYIEPERVLSLRESLLWLLAYGDNPQGNVYQAALRTVATLALIYPDAGEDVIAAIANKEERQRVRSGLKRIAADELVTPVSVYLGGMHDAGIYTLLSSDGDAVRRLVVEILNAGLNEKTVHGLMRLVARRSLKLLQAT